MSFRSALRETGSRLMRLPGLVSCGILALCLLVLPVACTNITATSTTLTSSTTLDETPVYPVPPHIYLFSSSEFIGQTKTASIDVGGDWRIINDADWLKVSLSSIKKGTAMQLQVADNSLKPGEYTTTLRLESATGDSVVSLPVTLNVMSKKIGDIFAIPLSIQYETRFTDDISFPQFTITAGVLERPVLVRDLYYDEGDPCLLISGLVTNTSNETLYLLTNGKGYNDSENQTSFCLAQGPVVGLAFLIIPPGESADINMPMSWTEDISIMKLAFSNGKSVLFSTLPSR